MYLPLPVKRAITVNQKLYMAGERTPLLDGYAANGHSTTYGQKFKAFFAADGEPSWATSLRFLFLGSWFNILLVFVPLSVASHHLNWDAGLRFAFSFFAIIPLAKVSLHIQHSRHDAVQIDVSS